MIWDPRRRVYVRPDGSIVSPAELRQLIERYINSEKALIEKESDSLFIAGASAAAITLFFNFMRDKIKEIHGSAGLTAYGGESEMNPERWARIGEKISSEYGYLNKFEKGVEEARESTDEILRIVSRVAPSVNPALVEQAVLANPPAQVVQAIEAIVEVPVVVPEKTFESLIWGDVQNRAGSYSGATYSTFENNQKMREQDAGVLEGRRVHEGDSNVCDDCLNAASDEYVPLGELLDIGDSICQNSCRCVVEYNYHGIEPLSVDRSIYV